MAKITLHVYDENFVYRGRIVNWVNMTWKEEFRGEGGFTLITHDSDEYAKLLRRGWYYYRKDRKVAMVASKVQRKTKDKTITLCGATALHRLRRRTVTLPVSIKNVEAGVYSLINNNLRGLPGIATAATKGLGGEYETEIEGTNLLDAVLEVVGESDYGVRAVFDIDNKRNIIEVYEGVDRSYSDESGGTVFSQEFGNLRDLVSTEDDDQYANVAYVTGSANNDPRTVYYQYVAPDAGDKANWREIIVNGESQGSDESTDAWKARQKRLAIKALQEHKDANAFEVDLPPEAFGKKYDLGDTVTCQSKRFDVRFSLPITEYKYTYKKGAEKSTVIVGNKPTDFILGAVRKNG